MSRAWGTPSGFATRYLGTDIDGVRLDPDRLEVRGRDLNDLVGQIGFEAALWHVWVGRLPVPAETEAVRLRLAHLAAGFTPDDPTLRAARAAASAGTDPLLATAAGLLRGVDALRERVPASPLTGTARPPASLAGAGADDFDTLLACVASIPELLRAVTGSPDTPATPSADTGRDPTRDPCAHPDPDPEDPTSTQARRLLLAAGATRPGAAFAPQVMDSLLVAWHAGFGYVTPTVLMARCAIGTGVGLAQALAAGCMANGPKHVGATPASMRWLAALAADGGGLSPGPGDLDRCAATAVDRCLDRDGGVVPGFGHPLFETDPRPPRLCALWRAGSFDGPHLKLLEAAGRRLHERKGLKPNVDAVTAAALLDLGIVDPHWGIGIGLGARLAAMAAHAVERRRRPAFGAHRRTARAQLAAVPVGWL